MTDERELLRRTAEIRGAIRIAISSWRTTESDIDRTLAAFESALVAA